MIVRKKTLSVKVGDCIVGGDAPITIQSMTNTDTRDYEKTLAQVNDLAKAGCALVRLAVPDENAAKVFGKLVKASPVPLVADIHFDYKLALMSLEYGAAKVRINPGNIGGNTRAAEVVRQAQRVGAALRIGVNSGSLPRDMLAKHHGPTAGAMVETALGYVRFVREMGFDQLVVSLKSSSVVRTIESYRIFSEHSDLPLHLGVTEAGTTNRGTIRSAVGIGALLSQGIGDTLRVSLTADPLQEVGVAKEILSCLGLMPQRLEIISCPTCARTSADLISVAEKVEEELEAYCELPVRIAVMGCSVNGPGEAREADFGIALAGGKAVFFRHGKPDGLLELQDAVEMLVREVRATGR